MDRDGRLVGRETTLRIAEAVLDESLAGAGQLLLVSGEAGIGKSALLSEIARRAGERGARVLRGVCWDGPGAPPYWPWTQVLRGIETNSVEPVGEAGRLLGGQSAGEASTAAQAADDRFRLFDSVAASLVRQAREAPLVVLLDDLQWADESSLELLEFVTGQLAAERTLLLCAYRDTEAPDRLRGLGGQVLPLTGVSPTDVGALMAAVAGSLPSAERAEAVWRRCGGNPFFVRELTRLMVSSGEWEQAGLDRASFPEAVRQTLSRRLARLSQPCSEMLVVAATAGAHVRPEVLGSVLGADPEAIADLLDEAVRGGVAILDGGVRVAHDLFREAILATVPAGRRAELHAAVGRVLQEMAGGPAAQDLSGVGGAARLAAHFVAAGPAESAQALHYSVQAAHEATARLGHVDAARHYENALRVLDGDWNRRVELLLDLAAAWDRAGDQGAARAAYRQAAELARTHANAPAMGQAALGMHALGSRSGSDNRECAELLTAADAALRDMPPPADRGPDRTAALRSGLLAALARMHRHASTEALDPRVHATAREAIELAEAADDPAALARALLAAHDVSWEPDSARDRLKILGQMADAAKRSGDQDLMAEAQLLRSAALIELGDPAGRAELTQYTLMADGLGHARGRWGALSRRATLAQMAGRVKEAVEFSDAALELGQAIGIPDAQGVFMTLRGSLDALGGPDSALGEMLPETDPMWPVFPLLRAWIALQVGDRDGAAALMRGFAVQDISYKYDFELLAVAATTCAAVGSQAQREWVYARLEPLAGLHVVVGGCAAYNGAVDHFLGLLAAALGLEARASEHFDAAIAMHERLGTPAWAGLSRVQLDRLQVAAPDNVFRNDGGTWRMAFDGREAHLPDAKGLHDIATLLGTPGREVHVLTLLGSTVAPTGADPILDERAKAQYAARLAELDAEIAEADNWPDPLRSERACAERDALVHELAAAAGLGSRRRRLGDENERARKTVRARIREALVRIERVHPALARHLHDSLTTGTMCVYSPPDGSRWLL